MPLPEVIGWVKEIGQIGFTGLALLWLFLERQERLRLQTERDALLERVLKAMNDLSVAMQGVRDTIQTVTGLLSRTRRHDGDAL